MGRPTDANAEQAPAPHTDNAKGEVTAILTAPDHRPARAPILGRGSRSTDASAPPPAVAQTIDPVVPPEPVRAVEISCARCSRTNDAGRRFCTKCGYSLIVGTPGQDAEDEDDRWRKGPWWRRLLDRWRTKESRSARRSYRRSLPMRYRLSRWLGVGLVVALLSGGFVIAGRSPATVVRDRWWDITDRQERVSATATADPFGCILLPEYAPPYAVDGLATTAWARNWDPAHPGTGECDATVGGDLLLDLGETREVRGLEILAGFPALESEQWQPTELELVFADGSVQNVPLQQSQALQQVELDEPVNTSLVRVAVIKAAEPEAGPSVGRVAISEIVITARPRNH